VLQEGGLGHFSIGYGQGEHGAQEAMRRALSSPLLGRDGIEGAQAMIVNFRGGDQMSLHDVTRAMEPVSDLVVADAPIFFGTCNDNALDERVEVTLIAVGLNEPTVASLPRPRLSPIPLTQKKSTRKKIDVAPVDDNDSAPPRKVVGLPMIELPQPNETVWNSTALNFAGERTDPYPMDDLSVPAFIRRRKRVTA
jgi:cell division protein FtsZ